MTYVTINKNTILRNAVHGTNDPPIAVRKTKSGKAVYGHRVKINGPCKLVYRASKPMMKCGARLVLITDAKVEIR